MHSGRSTASGTPKRRPASRPQKRTPLDSNSSRDSGSCRSTAPLTRGAEAANVVGELPGRRDGAPTIVGGHHDGWFRAAFDDASAVAITLELARAFAEEGRPPERPIVFVSHTAEEYGLTNSSYDWCTAPGTSRRGAPGVVDGSHLLPQHRGLRHSASFTLDIPPELRRWIRGLPPRARDGLLRTASSSQRRRPGPKCGPFSRRGSPESTSRRSPLRSTGPSTTRSTTRPTGGLRLPRVLPKCARALRERMPAQPTSSTSPRARETSPGRWTERSIARSHPPLRSSSARPAGNGSPRSVVGCTASTHARARAIRTSKRPPTSLGSRRHWSTYAPEDRARREVARPRRPQLALRRSRARGVPTSSSHDAERDAPRATWAARGDPDGARISGTSSPRSAANRGARPSGPWLEEHVRSSWRPRGASSNDASGGWPRPRPGGSSPCPRPRKEDLPS